jgi:sulfoxide reductase heme-binding subunit YedZ
MATPNRWPVFTRAWICTVISDRPIKSDRLIRLFKPALFAALCLPLAWLVWAVSLELTEPGSGLGADPGEAVVLHLGEWTLRILLSALAVSPLRRVTGWSWLIRSRRMIGLWGFAYLCLHVTAYLGLLAEFDWRLVLEDLVKRSYITAGLLALLLLIPLAVTSTRGWQRRLGRRWQRLHRLVYPALVLGLIHLTWLTKDGYGEVVLYSVIFGLLMLERIYHGRSRQK